MGRHAGKHGGGKRRLRLLPILLGVIGLVVVIGLGVWWWGLRDSSDPIDADPQRAYAVVLDSRPCTEAGTDTTVEFQVAGRTVDASLGGCGFKQDQRVAIQYLGSNPELVRLVGVTATPASSTAKRLLPIAILAIGFVAAVAAVALIREKRKGRRRTAGTGSLTVAEMQAAVQASRPSSTTVPATDPVPEDPAATPAALSVANPPTGPEASAPPSAETPEQPTDLFAPRTGGS